jgi:uncharacterized membrane protein
MRAMSELLSLDLIAAASAVALFASAMLMLRGAGRRVPGCGAGSGCDSVTTSRWSKIGSLPVALGAALVYAGMLACALIVRFRPQFEWKLLVVQILIACCTLAAGAAIWFLFLQLLILRRLCSYCVLAHLGALAAGTLLALLLVPDMQRWDEPPALGAMIGGAALILLISIQVIVRPRLHRIAPPEEVMQQSVELPAPAIEPELEFLAEPTPPIEPPAPHPPAPAPPAPPPVVRPGRQITLLGGRLHFDSAIFPIVGPPDAKFLVATMMDYTCEFCRRLHPMLEEALRSFNGNLGALMVFAPLEPACNPLVEEFEPKHVNACAYARLALALASVDEAQFPAFHRWLFEGEHPPSVEQVERRAAQIAGEGRLRDALTGARVKQRLDDGLTLYRLTGKGPLPRVLLPTGVLMGEVSDSAYLITLLREQLAAPPIAPDRTPARTARPNPFSDRPIG